MYLQRFGSTPYGTFGRLRVGDHTFYTVECPWLNNTPSVSCVPLGAYRLLWRKTSTSVPPDYDGHTWYLSGGNVGIGDGYLRTNCAIHVGNTSLDVSGCIAVGASLGVVNGRWAVNGSISSMIELLKLVGPQESHLTIINSLMG